MRQNERSFQLWRKAVPVGIFPAPVVLAAAVWLSTRLCSRSVDGELWPAAVLFVLIGVAHIVTIVPSARTRWISLLSFLLYEAAAAFGFYGSLRVLLRGKRSRFGLRGGRVARGV